MVPQKPGIFGKAALGAVAGARPAQGKTLAGGLGACLLLWWSLLAGAQTTACEDSLGRFFTQMYLQGSYCTCATVHREVVTEQSRVRRHVQYTMPGLQMRQFGSLPDLSRVQARLWGTIVDGPGGWYAVSVQIYEAGREAEPLVRRLMRIQQGQEFEITAGPQQRMLLRARTPYHVTVDGENSALHPPQVLTVQGRACFYLVSGS